MELSGTKWIPSAHFLMPSKCEKNNEGDGTSWNQVELSGTKWEVNLLGNNDYGTCNVGAPWMDVSTPIGAE